MKKLTSFLSLFLLTLSLVAQNVTIKNLPLDSISIANAIVIDMNGTRWIGTEKGLLSIDANDKVSLTKVQINGDTTKTTAISAIYIDKQQNKWIGTYTGQVFKISPQGGFEKYDFTKFGEALITNLFTDANNNIWVSTAGNGIYTMNGMNSMNITQENSSLLHNQVFAFHQDTQGSLWIGTTKGLTKLSGINNWDKEKKIEGEVSALAEYNGDLWVGVVGFQETELWKYENYRKWVKIELPNFLRYTRLMKFSFDRNGKLWIAANKIANLDNGVWNLYGDENGLTTNATTCLAFDAKNEIWIGSNGKGVFTTANIVLPEKKEDKQTPIVNFIEVKPPITESDGLNPELADENMLEKTMVLNIQFEQSKADLLPISIVELEKLVEILFRHPNWNLAVAGHTDNVGNAKLNQQLSEQRAVVVRDYLIQRGVEKGRITTEGYGGMKPIANNGDMRNREKNRRVEITLSKK